MDAHSARRLAAAALLALLVAISVAIPSSAATASTTTPTFTTTVTKRVAHPGTYAVVVTVPGRSVATSISVYAGAQSQRGLAITALQPAVLEFSVRVHGRSFTVRTVSTVEPASMGVAAALQAPQSSGGLAPPTGATGATGATGSTGSTGSAGPGAITIVSPPSGPYRKLVWSDEFAGPAGGAPNPSNWTPDTGGGCGTDTLSTATTSLANASTDGRGHLAITAIADPGGPTPYTSAQLDSKGLVSMRFGEIEARIEIPTGSGLCSAFWMVGDTTAAACDLQCGEIDIMEAISPYPSTVFATLHGPVSGSSNFQQWEQYVTATTPLAGTWHTYGLIWRPGRLVWTIDGVPYASATRSDLPSSAQWVFDGHSFHILLDTAVGGWPGPPKSGAPFPARMRVDWVRIYS